MAKLTDKEREEVEVICKEILEIAKSYGELGNRKYMDDKRYNRLREFLMEKYRVRVRVGTQGCHWIKLRKNEQPGDKFKDVTFEEIMGE